MQAKHSGRRPRPGVAIASVGKVAMSAAGDCRVLYRVLVGGVEELVDERDLAPLTAGIAVLRPVPAPQPEPPRAA